MTRGAALAVLLALLAPPRVLAEDPPAGGPFEWREHWLLAQGRLTLPPVSPDILPKGAWAITADGDWGNDLGWRQPRPGESAVGRSFLVDGEHRTFSLAARRGLGRGLDVGVRLPLEWRGGGILDGVIDWFHGFTRKLGLPDNFRTRFATNLLRVDLYQAGRHLAWDDSPGTGLGRIELFGRWSLLASKETRLALVLRAAPPTGTGPFAAGGMAAAAQLSAARRIGASADLFGGVGVSVGDQRREGDVEYAPVRPEAFLALERRLSRRWSVLAQSNAAGRLVTNVDHYPWIQWYLSLGARLRMDSGWALEGGFTENIAEQQATTDFGVQLGLTRRLPSRR